MGGYARVASRELPAPMAMPDAEVVADEVAADEVAADEVAADDVGVRRFTSAGWLKDPGTRPTRKPPACATPGPAPIHPWRMDKVGRFITRRIEERLAAFEQLPRSCRRGRLAPRLLRRPRVVSEHRAEEASEFRMLYRVVVKRRSPNYGASGIPVTFYARPYQSASTEAEARGLRERAAREYPDAEEIVIVRGATYDELERECHSYTNGRGYVTSDVSHEGARERLEFAPLRESYPDPTPRPFWSYPSTKAEWHGLVALMRRVRDGASGGPDDGASETETR